MRGTLPAFSGVEPAAAPIGPVATLHFGSAVLMNGMSEHKVTLNWQRGDTPFEYQKYPRDHTWKFDGGHEMTASAAPAYLGNPANTDPEEAFVAALSSCHMLTFLAVACKKKFVMDEYTDNAVGHMEKNENGKMAIDRKSTRLNSSHE